MELWDFNKHFVKNTGKRDPIEKHFGVVFIDTLKTTFLMENDGHTQGLFFQN